MKHFQQTIRRVMRFRLRSRALIRIAVICGLICVLLLGIALFTGHFLSEDSYITGFAVREIADDGESLLLSGADGKQLHLSRSAMGSDSYFRVKKAITEGSFVRAMIHHNIVEELQIGGKTVYESEADGISGIDVSVYLLGMSAFFLAASLVLVAALLRRKNRRRMRKNKK